MDRIPQSVVGSVGERTAARYLERAGYVLLDRNWRYSDAQLRGELDIVARDGDLIVFCEVKTRRTLAFGRPIEAVVPAKAQRIRRLGLAWLRHARLRASRIRFDVVGVWFHPSGSAHLDHIRAAF